MPGSFLVFSTFTGNLNSFQFMRFLILFLILMPGAIQGQVVDLYKKPGETQSEQERILRHVVLFKFKEGTPEEEIRKVEESFYNLTDKIPEIRDFEWGTNNSPEGLDKGFTHCFFLTFSSEADRDIYLPHPDHMAFVTVLAPWLEDVLVVDYWVKG